MISRGCAICTSCNTCYIVSWLFWWMLAAGWLLISTSKLLQATTSQRSRCWKACCRKSWKISWQPERSNFLCIVMENVFVVFLCSNFCHWKTWVVQDCCVDVGIWISGQKKIWNWKLILSERKCWMGDSLLSRSAPTPCMVSRELKLGSCRALKYHRLIDKLHYDLSPFLKVQLRRGILLWCFHEQFSNDF